MPRRAAAFLVLALAAVLAGCAGQSDGKPKAWYATHGGVAPKGDRIYVCHGFGCYWRTAFTYSRRDLRHLRRILRKGRRSPAAERKAIARAVSWSEKRVAKTVGSANDVGGLDLHNAGVRGQMDCIDEATNTTSLLRIAERRGYLKYHRVTSPVARGFFLDGRYPHATAVVAEKKSGKTFAIDSWPHPNGALPDVMPLEAWFAARPNA